jgi:hypothetical protein
MSEIDPKAEYTQAQVAAVLNIPESLAQSLWQQWPVCGYDVLGYCHRQGIPYRIRPLAPESRFSRKLRVAKARSENRTEQELIPMRDHYRRMMPEERERFADLIRTLATTTEKFSVSHIYVRVHYIFEACDEHGNCVYSESAEVSPEAIRKAIPLWEETADIQS